MSDMTRFGHLNHNDFNKHYLQMLVENKYSLSYRQQMFQEECSICCLTKERCSQGKDKERPADICYDCWYKHILSTVSRISYRIGDNILSPFNNGGSYDIVTCLNSVESQQSTQIEETLFMKYSAFTKDIQKCPSESCDFIYVGEKCTWNHPNNIYNCPKCEMPLIANQNFTLKNFLASIYLLLANKCPKCDIPIQKISGCPHMTCPCGHHFCWYCYKDHPSGVAKRVYTVHNVRECVFIFLSKIALFLICLCSLLITFNGNSTIKWCLGMLGTLFSVIVRALILDLVILLQVIVAMMNKKRPTLRARERKRSTMAFVLIGFNLLFITLLYLIDELNFFALVLFSQISILGICFGLGYAVIYSVQTWFQFIA